MAKPKYQIVFYHARGKNTTKIAGAVGTLKDINRQFNLYGLIVEAMVNYNTRKVITFTNLNKSKEWFSKETEAYLERNYEDNPKNICKDFNPAFNNLGSMYELSEIKELQKMIDATGVSDLAYTYLELRYKQLVSDYNTQHSSYLLGVKSAIQSVLERR